jgi:predicted CxxxxCH...CXXCH cytochrome family protein
VACHGSGLPETPAVVPQWADTSGAAKACGACHGAPPETDHTTSASCDRSTCHGSEVTRDARGVLGISTAGKSLHIDGLIESAL